MNVILIGDPGGGMEPMSVPFGDFFVEGTPRPWPRAGEQVITPKGGGKPFVHHFKADHEDKRHAKWRRLVRDASKIIMPNEPLDEPVILTVNVYTPRPQALMGRRYFDGPIPHAVQGDLDNYVKVIMDVLSPDRKTKLGGLWRNDGRVFCGHWMKLYAAKDKGPGMYVLVETVDPESQVSFPSASPGLTYGLTPDMAKKLAPKR